MDRPAYQIEKAIKEQLRNLLEILFQATVFVIDTIRTFFLIVLSILGLIAFAISDWDDFQSTLTSKALNPIIEHRIPWNTSANLTTANFKKSYSGDVSAFPRQFDATMGNLNPATTYH